jgi:hypothetical protein
MKSTLRLTESEFNKFIKRIINESKNEIGEALGSGSTNARPDSSKTTFENRTIELGQNLFKLGSDKIDTNSEEFKKAKAIIEKSGAGEISIQGGASSVGGEDYDNQGLADKRANNFKKALQNSGIDTSKMNVIPGIVTPNTDTPNSPEANKAQFVRFTMTGIQMGFSQQFAIDNVATGRAVIPVNKVKVKSDTKTVGNTNMDVRIVLSKDKSQEKVLNLIKSALKGVAIQVNTMNKY